MAKSIVHPTEAEVHEQGLGHANVQVECADALVAGEAGFGATEQQFATLLDLGEFYTDIS